MRPKFTGRWTRGDGQMTQSDAAARHNDVWADIRENDDDHTEQLEILTWAAHIQHIMKGWQVGVSIFYILSQIQLILKI